MREISEFSLKLSSIKLDKGEITRLIGHEFIVDADRLIDQLASVEAKGAFTIIHASESNFNYGNQIAPVFLKAENIALFVATMGKESKQIIDSNRSDPFEYYMVDFIASQFAEGMAGYIHDKIKKYATEASYGFSNRYSPGYCGWSVIEQKKLFGFFPENPCGIRLTESCLMDPVKSVSGAIALGPDVKYQEYGCKKCEEINCLYKSKL
ncbi:MAG: vitamin B12 dependent-methionine synthase activation domain-containing protein [Rikenellaceae bacterium]